MKHAAAQGDGLGPGDGFHLRVAEVLEHAEDDHFFLIARQSVEGREQLGDLFALLQIIRCATRYLIRIAAQLDAFEIELGDVANGTALLSASLINREISGDGKQPRAEFLRIPVRRGKPNARRKTSWPIDSTSSTLPSIR